MAKTLAAPNQSPIKFTLRPHCVFTEIESAYVMDVFVQVIVYLIAAAIVCAAITDVSFLIAAQGGCGPRDENQEFFWIFPGTTCYDGPAKIFYSSRSQPYAK